MTVRSFPAARALAVFLAAILVVGCTSAPGSSPSSANGSPSAQGCAATPAPFATPEGWDVASQQPSVFPLIINPSGAIACGATRLMFSFLDADNAPVAAPDRSVEVALYDLGANASTAVITGPATFVWAIEPTTGVYVIDADFPTSGTWGAEFRTAVADAAPETIRVTFEVQPTSAVVAVGERAPASETPTLADVGGDVAKISTDDSPVLAFYETSVADALAAKRPFVVAFATPKFCVTAQCGPTLDRIKPIAAANPDLTFINVEPYQLQDVDGQLQPVLTGDSGKLTPTAATTEWRLVAEPWVFVVDKDGIVRASFMLIFSDDELEAAIAAVEPAS
ncbi:MAG: hypothetical protein ACXW4T_07750 [Candidatus Limnocylindrales bacterium]